MSAPHDHPTPSNHHHHSNHRNHRNHRNQNYIYLSLTAKGVDMESPYMMVEETAALFRRSVKTIRKWNSSDRCTGKKRMCGFPDPAHHGMFLKSDIEKFGKLYNDDR
jgi:hypothetical protein